MLTFPGGHYTTLNPNGEPLDRVIFDAHLIRCGVSGGIDMTVEEWAELLFGGQRQAKRIEELLEEAHTLEEDRLPT